MKRAVKIAAWMVGGLCILILVVAFAIVALLHRPSFRQYVLRVAHQQILDATGFDLRLKDFSVQLKGFSPTVDMVDVSVEAAPPHNTEPLLHVDHVSVGLTVISLLHRNWYLNELTLNHPVARIVMDEHGTTNIPEPKNKDSSSKTSIFDLGVRHVHIDSGEIHYNDKEDALKADLQNLQFQSTFDPLRKQYAGELTYRDGVITFGTYNPLRHDLDAEFDVTSDTFHIKTAKLRSGNSQLDVVATLENFADPKLQATYQAVLDASQLRELIKDNSLPTGVIRLAGTAQYQQQSNKPPLDSMNLEGNLTSDALLIDTPSVRTQIREIHGRYTLRDGNVDVRDLSAAVLGGGVHGFLHIEDINGVAKAELQATVQNIALRSAQALANPQSLRDIALTGNASGDLEAHWTKNLDTLIARADANVHGTIAPSGQANGNVPLNGVVHAEYSAAAKQLTFSQSLIRMPQTSLALNGSISKRSVLQIQFVSGDLHEVETAAAVFSPEISQQHLDLHGAASFTGTVRGSTDVPEIQGQFSATDLRVRNTEWQSARGTIDVTPSHINVTNAEIVPTNRGHLAFNISADLKHWSFDKTMPIQVDLNATNLDLEQVKTLSGLQIPATGTIAANLSIHGSADNPIGQGILNITQATVSGEPIQTISATFQGTGSEVHGKLNILMPAGGVEGTLTYFPKQQAYDTTFSSNGLHLDQIATLKARNIQLKGVLNIQATGRGTFRNPGIQLKVQIPQLTVQNQTINDLTLQADVANHIATVNLDSQAMNTFVKGHGTVNLTGEYNVDATFDSSTIALQPIVAAYSAAQAANISGQTELHATVKGPLKDTSRIEAHITIPTLDVAYKDSVKLAATSPIKLDYSNSVLTIERTEIRGTDTDLQLQGSIPVKTGAPASLLLVGTVDLKIAELLDKEVVSSGQLRFNIDTYGQTANPNVQGQIQLVNANFVMPDLPFGVEDANGALNLTTSRLQIRNMTATIGGGMVKLNGGMTYRPSVQYDLAITGRDLRFHLPEGVREGMDADLALTGNKDSGMVQGQVRLNDISFARDFDFSSISGIFSSINPQVPNPLLQKLHLNVGVQSTTDLNLVSSTLSLQGTANLRVQGTAADPVLLGRVNVTGGDVMFRGARYEVQPSTVAFVNPFHIEPQLNANVDTTVQDYKVHMQFRGKLDHLRTTYTSEPPLPEADVINLLVFGKTTEQQSANPVPGNVAAESAIASAVSGQVTGRIQQVAGISSISVDPALQAGGQQNNATRITVQQHVTATIFVTFSADVTGAQRQVVKLEYQYSPRLSVVGVRDENGGFALAFRIHNTW